MKILRLRRQPAFDMSKAVAEAHGSFNSKPEHAFKFYTYAKTYWQDHVLYISGHKAAIFKLSSKLIYGRASELKKMDKHYWMRFQCAAGNGNGNFLVLLLQVGNIDTNARDNDGLTPLMRAAVNGYKDTVEVLLSVGKADVNAKNEDGLTPQTLAARYGHRDTVEVLLSVGKADVNAKNEDGWTPLVFATREGPLLLPAWASS